MTPCRARWERYRFNPATREWEYVFLCGGSKWNPDPCELHGCGERLSPDTTRFRALCRCPTPEGGPTP